jgi:hypothetical protein
MAVVATGLGWVVHGVRQQRDAVAELQAAGGSILYDFHVTGERSWSTAGEPRGPQWLRDVLGPEYFDRPDAASITPDDEAMAWVEAVNGLPTVKHLLIGGRHVTDEVLERLDSSEALVELQMAGSSISDAGLAHLAKFPNLRWLVLNGAAIGDEGVDHLTALTKLEELSLKNTRVSDESVDTLRGFPSLKQIDLRGSLVTQDGATRVGSKVTMRWRRP